MLQQLDSAIAFAVVMLMISLIVTTIVQVISALTDLRGRNLAAGLANLFRQMEPGFRERLPDGSTMAQHIAEVVVRHPAIAHAGRHAATRAKAISKSELIKVLEDLCSDEPAAVVLPAAKEKLKALLDQRVPGGQRTAAAAEAVAAQLIAKFPAQQNEVKAAVQAAYTSVSQLEQGVDRWFDTVMNRLSDIFTRSTRTITVIVSALLVIALHLDSGEILRQITNSPDLRAKIAAMYDTTLSQADRVFDSGERAAAALADVKATHKDDAQVVAALDKVTPHLTHCADGKNAVAEETAKLPNAAAIQQEFDQACQTATLHALSGTSLDNMRQLRADMDKTSLKIIPSDVGGVPVFDKPGHWWIAYGSRRHLLGTLASLVLLSLGAPFWFNALRQLSNLKPAISERVEGTSNS